MKSFVGHITKGTAENSGRKVIVPHSKKPIVFNETTVFIQILIDLHSVNAMVKNQCQLIIVTEGYALLCTFFKTEKPETLGSTYT